MIKKLLKTASGALKALAGVWRRRKAVLAANAWPDTGAAPTSGVMIGGVTTIRWGSKGLLQSPGSGAYVVLRFNERELAENIKLPNGSGLTSTRVLISDGVQWEVTVRDDTAFVPPQVGDTVSIVDGAGLILGTTAGAIKTFTATVVDSGFDTAPKQAAERTLTIESLKLVESDQTGSAQA